VEALVTYLARALVDRPDQVELRAQAVDGGTVLELKLAPEDVGKVIGRDGRTINAIRAVLAVAALRRGAKVRLEVLDQRASHFAALRECKERQIRRLLLAMRC